MKRTLLFLSWYLLSIPVVAVDDFELSLIRTETKMILAMSNTILNNPKVIRHIESGLTTTFRIEVRWQEPNKSQQTKVFALALRYELWEEKFFLSLFDGEEISLEKVLESRDELSDWWQKTRLPIAEKPAPDGTTYRLKIEVIPFSAQEREAAAAWVSQSLGSSTNAQQDDIGARILSTIVATSFKKRVLQSFIKRGKLP